jgi:2-dehydro-3-deoxygluconokinase/2-dehydro-3-deoxygalactonokinase
VYIGLVEIVCIGEPLVQFNAVTPGPLRNVSLFEKHVGGPETNVAVCVRKLDHSSGLIGRVGDDELGHFIAGWLRGIDVDTSYLKIDPSGPTAICLVQRGYPIPGRSRVYYYRKESAGSKLAPEDVDREFIAGARILHLSGVTPAISQSAMDACLKAVVIARDNDVLVSLDTQIRPQLWASLDDAASAIMKFIEFTNILFTDLGDAEVLIGENSPEKVTQVFKSLGVEVVVLRLGERGAIAARGSELAEAEPLPITAEDPLGASDALAGTFLSCLVEGRSLFESLRKSMISWSLVASTRGEQENLPTSRDLDGAFRALYP